MSAGILANEAQAGGAAHPNGLALRNLDFPLCASAEEARRFLQLLDCEADAFLFAAGDDDKERKKRLIAEAKAVNSTPVVWKHRRDTIEGACSWIQAQQENGWGVFLAVQAMRATRCQIGELAYIRAVYAEMDIGEPLQPWPIEPSIIVETSPGRYHAYWLVFPEAPISDDDFHGIMMRLVETYGSDPAAKDLARRLRLPGTWNLKPGRKPHLVTVVHETGARYARHELLEAFPPPPRPKPDPAAPRPKLNGHTPPGLERFVGRSQDGPLWSIPAEAYEDWLPVGMALHAESGGSSEGLALWDQWSASSHKWSEGACAEKWTSFGVRNGINGGTIYHMAAERGWTKPTDSAGHSHRRSGSPADDRRQELPQTIQSALEFDDQIEIETNVTAVVKAVLHPRDVAALYGLSGVGKTFLATDICYHVAHGVDWQGRRVKQGAVLYVGLEGARGLRHRMAAYARHMGSAGRMLARLTIHTALDKSDAGKAGEATIIEQAKLLEVEAGKPVGLIVVDTLARAIAGGRGARPLSCVTSATSRFM